MRIVYSAHFNDDGTFRILSDRNELNKPKQGHKHVPENPVRNYEGYSYSEWREVPKEETLPETD